MNKELGVGCDRPLRSAVRTVLLVAVGLALVGVAWTAAGLQEQTFPHDRHQGLFPLCAGCHEGVPSNDRARFYPRVDLCNQCHVGDQARTDTWTQRGPQVSNLRFRHGTHEQLLGDFAPTCEACHSDPGGPGMAVSRHVQLGICWTCHAATEHVVDAPCATCHVPLAESGLPVERIAAFPFPADHASPGFLIADHGSKASGQSTRCATCHTADRCTACHVAADRDEIVALRAAPEGMELPPTYGRYVEPASHADEDWLAAHGARASRAECGTCHTSDSCTACHVSPVPAPVASLPARDQVVAPGVQIARHPPASHASLFFMEDHATLAASDAGVCSTCHAESFCVQCHDGPFNGGYHPPQFVARHKAQAFGQDAECATCHNTQAFCRSCHVDSGLGSFGRLGPGFHDAQSQWFLRHGQAARQNLETCASCHAQRDCTQCHGVLGAFRVSPHSKDFDAQDAWKRNPRTCRACHILNPLGGSEP